MSELLNNIWAIFLVILFFGGSIFVHELGHFLIAKRRKLKVPRFSIGFGPKIISWKKNETEYRISLFPLGGYVALPQLAEMPEIEGQHEQNLPAASFTDKILVSVMGAVFNIIFALILASILWVIGKPVKEQEQTTTIGHVLQYIEKDDSKLVGPAYKAGLLSGDEILEIDGVKVNNFSDILKNIIMGSGRDNNGNPLSTIKVKRGEEIKTFNVFPSKVPTNSISKDYVRTIGIVPKTSLVVNSLAKNSPAITSGLEIDDKIIAADDIPLNSIYSLQEHLKETEGKEINLSVERDKKIFNIKILPKSIPYRRNWLSFKTKNSTVEVYPHYTSEGTSSLRILYAEGNLSSNFVPENSILSLNNNKINSINELEEFLNAENNEDNLSFEILRNKENIFFNLSKSKIQEVNKHPTLHFYRLGIAFKEQTTLSRISPFKQIKITLKNTLETFAKLFNQKSDIQVRHLMGPPGILRLLHSFSLKNFRALLWFVIVLNVNLAVLNLLPIPILDGGHIMFACIEKLIGKTISTKIMSMLQSAFVILFISLMLYVSFFDIKRWQGDSKDKQYYSKLQKLNLPYKF